MTTTRRTATKKKSGRTSNEIGRDAEQRAASLLGGSLVPGSGSIKFLKLDVSDRGGFTYGVKSSEGVGTTALRAIGRLWREAIRGTRGFSGHGDGAKPALIFELDGELLLLTRLTDHVDLATGAAEPYIASDKAQERRARSRSSLLWDSDTMP